MAPVQDAIICCKGVMSLPITGLEIVSDDSPIVSSVYITIKTKHKTDKFEKTQRASFCVDLEMQYQPCSVIFL